ncbi:MAG: lysophospholipid acyltransferase family protein [Acidobacteriaceae bacterium]
MLAVLRAALRLVALLFSLARIAVRFRLLAFRRGSRLDLNDRARWLHLSCRTVLRSLGVRPECRGLRPVRGLVCSNHLSYLDIAVYAATLPCVFVSKVEVSRWPVFGFFARAGGTLFIDRQSRASTEQVAGHIAAALATGIPVLLFPEGTSTDGSAVLRFHPSLLEPAIRAEADIAAAAIAYRAADRPERDLCWFGDAPFLPHLLRTLGYRGVTATVEFYPEPAAYTDRKAAALEVQEKVEALRKRIKTEAPS